MRRVFCLGLPKTGTSTFRQAMKILGYRVAGFEMSNCDRYLQGDVEFLMKELEQYDAAQDWPWPLLYEAIFHCFPDALFVLTTRSSETVWFESLLAHAAGRATLQGPPGMRERVFGYRDPADNPDHHIRFYLEHNKSVRRYFADRGELVELSWDRGDGWPNLCGPLGLPVPSVRFPHAKRRPRPGALAR